MGGLRHMSHSLGSALNGSVLVQLSKCIPYNVWDELRTASSIAAAVRLFDPIVMCQTLLSGMSRRKRHGRGSAIGLFLGCTSDLVPPFAPTSFEASALSSSFYTTYPR